MNITSSKRFHSGFTLIELLVVIGILAVLLAITLIAINPARQFAQANNTKRASDVNAILNAIGQYAADNKGLLPAAITATPTEIRGTAGGVDLCPTLMTQYLAGIPVDPQTNNGDPVTSCNNTYLTNYWVSRSAADSRVTVSAPGAQLSQTISVTR